MLEEEAREALLRIREALAGHMDEADALGHGLLGAKLSEAVDVIDSETGAGLR